mmetsp:Transcript_1586/g.5717  ORF Transcript_1586/g.5717 Transcript_1586/m.5717 type:complete len:204 (-) Transcript_1586:42-653(-)
MRRRLPERIRGTPRARARRASQHTAAAQSTRPAVGPCPTQPLATGSRRPRAPPTQSPRGAKRTAPGQRRSVASAAGRPAVAAPAARVACRVPARRRRGRATWRCALRGGRRGRRRLGRSFSASAPRGTAPAPVRARRVRPRRRKRAAAAPPRPPAQPAASARRSRSAFLQRALIDAPARHLSAWVSDARAAQRATAPAQAKGG